MSAESVDVELMRRGKSVFFRTFAGPRLSVLSDLYFYCVSFANTMYRCLDILKCSKLWLCVYRVYSESDTTYTESTKRMSTTK